MAPTTLTPVPPPANASRFTIRALESSDFRNLQRLEQEIWSGDPTGQLCPFYLRLCTEHYADWCFIAFEGERPVGYVLNFPRAKVNYCATLAVHPDYQKSKANYLLIRAMVVKLLQEDMEECRFLVEPDNWEARSVHEALGARVEREVRDFYREGDTRLWSAITKDDLERIRAKYTRLRLVS
jgi:ribosomal protein S18 acetylase RimI-like enzyme